MQLTFFIVWGRDVLKGLDIILLLDVNVDMLWITD